MGESVGRITRRQFALGAGGTIGAAVFASGPLGLFSVERADATTRTFFRLIRATDQLVVDLELLDLEVTAGFITPTGAGPGSLRLTFGSQHTAEAALNGTAGTPTAPDLAFGHRIAGASRVVFEVDGPIPFTLDSVLDLSQHALVLDSRAEDLGGGAVPSAPPAADVTSIEIPYDLRISPHQFARFGTDPQPQTIDDVTEVFRLRIGRLNGGVFTEQPINQPRGRALHTAGSTDPSGPDIDTKYLPDVGDRADLVELLAGTDRSFEIERLWLSTAGGAFSTSVGFEPPRPAGNDLASWTQRVVTGRDTFVQIVTAGFVLPWGLPAAIIEQTERRFISTTGGGLTAAMVFEEYLVTSPAVVDPNAGNGAPNDGNTLPFDDMKLGTLEQRPIARGNMPNADPEDAFWVLDGATNDAVEVPTTVTDKAGNEHTVAMPVAFVVASVANDEAGVSTDIADVISDYNSQNGAPAGAVREVDFGGRRVGWTPPRTVEEGTVSTERMRFVVAGRTPSVVNGLPGFAPTVDRAWIVDDTVGGATGQEQPSIEVRIPDLWRDHADGSGNPAGAFLEYINPINVGGFSGSGGGVGSPGLRLDGLSLAFGAGLDLGVPGIGGALSWDPAAALNGATILGFIDLGTLLNAVTLTPIGGSLNGPDLPQIPRFSIDVPSLPSVPEEVCYRFDWTTDDLSTQGLFLAGSDAPSVSGDASLSLEILTCIAPLELDAAQTIDAEVKNFGVAVPPSNIAVTAIELGFHSIRYSKLPGQDATTNVDFAGLRFVGALGFLEPVKALFGSVGDAFSVLPSADGVEAEAKFPIPPINLGVLGIRNLEGIVGVDLSFDGSPIIMNASLGRKVDPFTVNVLSAGGTGWFELDASAETGIDRLAAGFTVTYSMGINVVVAKVSITGYIGGGIEIVNDEVTVLVIIGIEGTASAFGLSVGFTAELELQYNVNNEVLRGIASVTVGFYSKIVDVEKTFEIEQEIVLGDGSPPADQPQGLAAPPAPAALAFAAGTSGFSDQYSAAAWTDYCDSFA